jgi:hypothetical protein
MFDVGDGDVPGAIAGPPGAGDGGGSSGTALTGPRPNMSADMPTAAAAAAALTLREMPMMIVPPRGFLAIALIGGFSATPITPLATPRG